MNKLNKQTPNMTTNLKVQRKFTEFNQKSPNIHNGKLHRKVTEMVTEK